MPSLPHSVSKPCFGLSIGKPPAPPPAIIRGILSIVATKDPPPPLPPELPTPKPSCPTSICNICPCSNSMPPFIFAPRPTYPSHNHHLLHKLQLYMCQYTAQPIPVCLRLKSHYHPMKYLHRLYHIGFAQVQNSLPVRNW